MTNEVRTAAMSNFESAIKTTGFDAYLIPARVGKKNAYLFNTGVDDDGDTIYLQVETTIKNPKATKTTEGFDAEAAIQAYEDYVSEQANKPAKTAKADKGVNPEVAKRKEARKEAMRNWVRTDAKADHSYTATELKDAISNEELFPTPMLAATTAALLVEEGMFDLTVGEDKKKYYTVR